MTNILTLESEVLEIQKKSFVHLTEYACDFWMSHFLEIDPEVLEKEDVVAVIRSLLKVVKNPHTALKKIEEESAWSVVHRIRHTPDVVNVWADCGLRCSGLSNEELAWLHSLKNDRFQLIINFAAGHVTSWFFFHAPGGRDATASFVAARDSFEMVIISYHIRD